MTGPLTLPRTTDGRSTAWVLCPWCPWVAQMTALDAREVARCLGARYAEHVFTQHPEQLLPPVEGRPS